MLCCLRLVQFLVSFGVWSTLAFRRSVGPGRRDGVRRQDQDLFMRELRRTVVRQETRDDVSGDARMPKANLSSLVIEAAQPEQSRGASKQRCMWWSSKTVRMYHFFLKAVDGTPIAVRLVRSPKAPRLELGVNQTWDVRLTGDSNQPLDWRLTPVPGAPPTHLVHIDLETVVHIRRTPEIDGTVGIELKLSDGDSFSFYGGLFLPENLLAKALQKMKKSRTTLRSASDVRQQVSPGDAARGAAGRLADGSHAIGNSAMYGGVNGVVGGAAGMVAWTNGAFAGFVENGIDGQIADSGWSYAVNTADWVTSWWSEGAIASSATESVAVDLAMTGLDPAQIALYGFYGGAAGGAAGFGIGLATGAVVATTKGVTKAVLQWRRNNRDMKLSASEKLFAKLECHGTFKRDEYGTLLVPKVR